MSQIYRLPDLLRDWPWTRRLNPYYLDAKAESTAWVSTFRPFDLRGQMAYDDCAFSLLASLTYPSRDREFLRTGCDLVNFFFVYDEYTDVADVSVAKALARTCISAMKNKEAKPDNPHILDEMVVQLLAQASKLAAPGSPSFEHLVSTLESYAKSVAEEVEDRVHNRIRSVEDYMWLRRDTSAARGVLALIELGLDLPIVVTRQPILVSLTQDAVDLIILVNDMHSYLREISCGSSHHNHNVITAIMAEHKLDSQDALIWLKSHSDKIVSRFLSNTKRIPSWGPDVDESVQTYIYCIGQWVRGHEDWSFESKRYHGDDGPKVREDRILRIYKRPGNYLRSDFEANVGEEFDLELATRMPSIHEGSALN